MSFATASQFEVEALGARVEEREPRAVDGLVGAVEML
jgi:hypothetical protein